MKANVLYVAYPLLPVSEQSCGGAEQMLIATEREMHARGWGTCLAAAEGSRPAGALFSTGSPAFAPDRFEERDLEQNLRVVSFLRSSTGKKFDLIHDKSGSFWKHAGYVDQPVLATLHLPRSFYAPELFDDIAANVFFNCVSDSQASQFRDLPGTMEVVQNGIDIDRFCLNSHRDGYLLCLGRICEEKGTAVALDVAAQSGFPIIIAGQVYPFSYHQRYFRREIAPRLQRMNGRARLLENLTVRDKVELLRHARALLLPTSAEETSSLVSMEAMACGTPVVAFRRGAVPEIVEDGVTGILVNTSEEMVGAVKRSREIDPNACRRIVEQRYSAQRMVDDYQRLYAGVIRKWRATTAAAA